MNDAKCASCGVRPNRGLSWTGKLYFGQVTTIEGLCVVCAAHGPERTVPTLVDAQDCGCSSQGRCSYHAAAEVMGADDVRGWTHVAGGEWEFERKLRVEAQNAGSVRVLVVDGAVAARVQGEADCLGLVWLPDGRAEVTFVDHEASIPAPAVLVPVGLMTTDDAMRDALVNRQTWSRWQWRGQAHLAASARNVCGECRATYSAKRATPHKCGETLDSRGRARLDPETYARRTRGRAALSRLKLHDKMGWTRKASDVALVEAAGFEVPAV